MLPSFEIPSSPSIIKPIDPDVTNRSMYLNMNWYTTPKLPGFSFMIRAKNEARNIGTCLLSLQKYIPASVPYELIIINNDSNDFTSEIASRIINLGRGDKVVNYPYKIAKPGLENYYTPLDSVHSFVYFTQFCLMQCRREWIFRWDADFEMSEQLGQWLKSFWDDHSLKKQYGAKIFEYVMIPATDQDGIVNSEMYLFHTQFDPFFYRRQIWEQVGFLKGGRPPFVYKADQQQALILHQSTLKYIKSSYLEEPWWITKLKKYATDPTLYTADYVKVMFEVEENCQAFKVKLAPDAQTFCRSMDPKPVEVVRLLPLKQDFGQIFPELCKLRNVVVKDFTPVQPV